MTANGVVSSISRRGQFEPFDLQVSRGQIYLHESVFVYGANPAIGNSFESIWQLGGTYTFPTTAYELKISSSSGNDSFTAGSGAKTLTIEGLDANYESVSVTVNMAGSTQVSTTGQTFIRVNKVYVATVGTYGTNFGTITVGNGYQTVAYILPAAGSTEQCIYTVPAGKTAYINRFTISSYNGISQNAPYSTCNQIDFYVRTFGGARRLTNSVLVPAQGTFVESFPYPYPITEKSDIDIRGYCFSQSSNIRVQLQMVLIQNNYEVTGG